MGRGVTFSSSWRSCLVRASLEHMVCWGATTVHTHLPSLSWAELYTCHDSSGLAGKTCERREKEKSDFTSNTTSKGYSLIYNPILIGITNTWHKITQDHICSCHIRSDHAHIHTHQSECSSVTSTTRKTNTSFIHTHSFMAVFDWQLLEWRDLVPFSCAILELVLQIQIRSQCVWSWWEWGTDGGLMNIRWCGSGES